MSIKRYKYPIERIELQISNSGNFADMAYFFDNPKVLEEIAKARKIWVNNKLIPNDKLDDFFNENRDLEEAKKFWWRFYPLVFKIATKFKVGYTFTRPITSAILSGVISDKDYSTGYKEGLVFRLPPEMQLDDEIIYASSTIRKAELINIKGAGDNKSISTIKRNRKWYWLYQRMGWRKLAKYLNESNEPNEPMDTIRSAVNSYRNKLNKYSRVV